MTESLMKKIRQRSGFEEHDTSHDEELNARSPRAKLSDIVGWEFGDSSWADSFLYWAKECGFIIEE